MKKKKETKITKHENIYNFCVHSLALTASVGFDYIGSARLSVGAGKG